MLLPTPYLAISLWAIFCFEIFIALLLFLEKRKQRSFQQQLEKELATTKQKLTTLIEKASDEAEKTISAAFNQYGKVHQDVEELSKTLQEKSQKISTELSNWEKETISEQLKEYELLLSEETKSTIQDLQEVSRTELKTLGNELAAAVAHTKSEVNQLLVAHSQAAAAELDKHTEAQKQRVTQQAEAIIDQVVSKYLTNHLTTTEKHAITTQLVEELLPTASKMEQQVEKV